MTRLLPTAHDSGRQPLCEAHQDQHDHSAREHQAEEDNTCRQVRMGRQVFAKPPGAPGLCRVTGHRFAPALQEPDWGCEHEGGTDDNEEGGKPFLSVSPPAQR